MGGAPFAAMPHRLLEGKTNVVLETEEVDIADYQYSYSLLV